jgi:7-cyano-7-deazaguanine synthase in queuosine biosynthesis
MTRVAPIVIRAPEQHTGEGRTTVVARLEVLGKGQDLWFRGPQGLLRAEGADAFVITCLPTAMKLGAQMVVEDAVSPKLLASLDTVQDILCKWHPGFRRVAIQAQPPKPRPAPAADRVAAFFSGGVDSFYTALKHRETLAALVLVHGFDMGLEKVELRSRVSRELQGAAAELGKPLLEIETNSRTITDPHTDWLYQQFGPALAGIAMLLDGFNRVLIPSAESYANLDVVASHPLLDPLWSTEYCSLVHDGCELDRAEKVAAIGDCPAVWRRLRVCWQNPNDAYNCGRCEKCIRTMLSLEAAGVLERTTAFEAELTPARVAAIQIPNKLVAYHFEEALRELRSVGSRPDLIRALERTLARARSKQVLAALAAIPALLPALVDRGLQCLTRRVRRPDA